MFCGSANSAVLTSYVYQQHNTVSFTMAQPGSPTTYAGFDTELIQLLSISLAFNYTFSRVKPEDWGSLDSTVIGRWSISQSPMVGEVRRGVSFPESLSEDSLLIQGLNLSNWTFGSRPGSIRIDDERGACGRCWLFPSISQVWGSMLFLKPKLATFSFASFIHPFSWGTWRFLCANLALGMLFLASLNGYGT